MEEFTCTAQSVPAMTIVSHVFSRYVWGNELHTVVGEDTTNQTNENRESLRWPTASIVEHGPDLLRARFIWGHLLIISNSRYILPFQNNHIDHWDQKGEEADDMEDQDEKFKFGQYRAGK